MKNYRNRDFVEDIVAEVRADYAVRREERRHFEAQWQLCSNFLAGNQYCSAGFSGLVEGSGKDYFWQEREVFNHIAFILETRLSKLNKVRPKLGVQPMDGGEDDIRAAQVSGKILESAYERLGVADTLMKGTQWSESVGSVFYKVSWDKNAGRQVGFVEDVPVFEGDVRVDVCPPYEVFPDSITHQDVSDCKSIIHVRALPVEDIHRIWGEAVNSEDVDTLGHSSFGAVGGLGLSSALPAAGRLRKNGYAMVIERYTAPTSAAPEGELAIVAGDKLLHLGPLPFRCGADGGFAIPFIKQDSLSRAGCFFGTSVIERAIPIQRAYNAVKNRKHEFLNRLSMGVLAVEDGSVDTDNLESEGLSPGKILVYRQGSTPPALLDPGTIPADFANEEEKLLSEFMMISGVSDIMRTTSVPGSIGSGAALKMLLEQDDARLSTTAERMRSAARAIAQFILRLYKQFAGQPRLSRCVDGGTVELIHWQAQSIAGDDVVLTSENELEGTAAQRREIVLQLLGTGILQDENGKLPADLRYKVLDALGYGSWESEDSGRLHTLRARRENSSITATAPVVREIDDHRLHISEHTRFMLSSDYERLVEALPELDEIMTAHILMHKEKEHPECVVGGSFCGNAANSAAADAAAADAKGNAVADIVAKGNAAAAEVVAKGNAATADVAAKGNAVAADVTAKGNAVANSAAKGNIAKSTAAKSKAGSESINAEVNEKNITSKGGK